MPQIPPLVDTKVIRPSETALALNLLSEFDLLRLKTIARLYARGLPPDVMWEDLLQEALTRVLTGSRRPPYGVAEQIRIGSGISKTDYDSARRRIRRTLLREGLTCEAK